MIHSLDLGVLKQGEITQFTYMQIQQAQELLTYWPAQYLEVDVAICVLCDSCYPLWMVFIK